MKELRAAFPARRAAAQFPLVDSFQGTEPARVVACFRDEPDWTALRPGWLDSVPDGLGSALSFLSPAAIRFYIPAYMTADLGGGLHSVDPTFSLVHGFDDLSRDARIRPRGETTWTDFSRARWDGLSPRQAAAVSRYLEWRALRDGPVLSAGIVQALGCYWYRRAPGRG